MIDPIEAVIAHLKSDADLVALVGDRIDTKHRYGGAWDRTADAALVITPSSGAVELYAPMQDLELELLAYAPTQHDAMLVWLRLIELSRSTDRAAVTVTGGDGLVYSLTQGSGPSLLYDDGVGMDFVFCLFIARVGEEAI
jgi:hypothetical protein